MTCTRKGFDDDINPMSSFLKDAQKLHEERHTGRHKRVKLFRKMDPNVMVAFFVDVAVWAFTRTIRIYDEVCVVVHRSINYCTTPAE